MTSSLYISFESWSSNLLFWCLLFRLAREAGLEFVEIQSLTDFYDDNRFEVSHTCRFSIFYHELLYVIVAPFEGCITMLMLFNSSCQSPVCKLADECWPEFR